MNDSILTGLLQNTAVLLSFSLLYDNFWVENEERRRIYHKVIIGCIIGAIGIVLMLSPWTLIPGIVFDTRSVMLSISGLLFGPLPTFIAILIDATFRIHIGGSGTLMGVAVICLSGFIGILWRWHRSEKIAQKPIGELIFLAITVHITMLACSILLPSSIRLRTLSAISIPLVFVYTPATILLGVLMLRQKRNWKNRKAQAILLESERRFIGILESTNLITLIIDKRGLINYCNNSLIELTKLSRSEIVGNDFFEVFIPTERQNEIRDLFLNLFFYREYKDSVETPLRRKDGKFLIISWNNTLLRNESGIPDSIAAIGINITEQKAFEEDLIEKNSIIETNNQEYIKINHALKQAKIKAEESEKLTSAFLANMSHEIRTPMNGILGFADLLKNPGLSGEEQQEYISIITKSGYRMLNLINDIVEISRLDSGMVPIKKTNTNINEQIKFLYQFFLPEAKSKNLILKITGLLPKGQDLIYTDQEKVYGVIMNLIKNALKYTNKGEIEVGCKISDVEVVVYVKDTGIGIPKEKIKSIFDRFVQGDMSLTSPFEGVGLGLAIANAYAKLLEGKLTVDSIEGEGSIFQFIMPLQLAKNVSISSTSLEDTGKINNVKDLSVLLVDDDKTSMMLIQILMKKYASIIYRATSGKEAIEIFEKNPGINLIFIDIKMSKMNGLEVVKHIRKTDSQVIIIAQTAYALTGDREHALETGCNEYLTKPIRNSDLDRSINKFFS